MAVEDLVQSILCEKKRSNRRSKRKKRKRGSDDDDDSSDDSSSYHEMEYCSGCASIAQDKSEEDYNLLLCDSCDPRAFCVRCVALAHGGTESAWSTAEAFCQNSSEPWYCICCKPTEELVIMRMNVQQSNIVARPEPDESDMARDSLENKVDKLESAKQHNVDSEKETDQSDNEKDRGLENKINILEGENQQAMDSETDPDEMMIGRRGNEVVIPDSAIQKCCACDIQLDEKLTVETAGERDEQPMDISTYLYSTHVHPLLRYVAIDVNCDST